MLPWLAMSSVVVMKSRIWAFLDRSLKGRVPIVSRARKFFGAVNSVVAKVGGKFTSDSVCCRRNYCQCYCLAATCGGYTRSRRVVT
eukprot:m.217359 g.217359  ORF g.217359 m.217359 type:complete len:86 (+) comp39881_c1_seq23:67-324(+)